MQSGAQPGLKESRRTRSNCYVPSIRRWWDVAYIRIPAHRRGAVGISTAHALALVHHGGGTSEELVTLARDIREGVRRKFDIELQPEPVFLGFPTSNPLDGG